MSLAMQAAAHALTQQFLAWIDEAPRSYADAVVRLGGGVQEG